MSRPRELHGSYSTYINHKCRCERCKMAHRDYMRKFRARKREQNEVIRQAQMLKEPQDIQDSGEVRMAVGRIPD